MKFRTITNADLDFWIRTQCDPVMMADLGGPQPLEKMPQIFKNTMNVVEGKTGWVEMVLVGPNEDQVAGSICLWESMHDGQKVNEMGWMILPEFQGQGIATQAVRGLLDRGRAEGRWDVVHAYPATGNPASNAVCRKAGFTLVGELDFDYSGRLLHCNDWQIDLRAVGK